MPMSSRAGPHASQPLSYDVYDHDVATYITIKRKKVSTIGVAMPRLQPCCLDITTPNDNHSG